MAEDISEKMEAHTLLRNLKEEIDTIGQHIIGLASLYQEGYIKSGSIVDSLKDDLDKLGHIEQKLLLLKLSLLKR